MLVRARRSGVRQIEPVCRSRLPAPADADQEERWPVICTVLLVAASSVLLWTLIIKGVGWLIG